MNRRVPEVLEKLRPELASAAQVVYDAWEQDDQGHDEVYGSGGICHDIAEAFQDVLSKHEISSTTFSFSDEVHVTAVADVDDEAWRVDVHHSVYERGGGYNWKKIRDVVFDPSDILIESMYHRFSEYLDDEELTENPGTTFSDGVSPLDYHGHRPSRLSAVDSSVSPPAQAETWFVTTKSRKGVVTEGAGPGVVAFVDYDLDPGYGLVIHYTRTRTDQRNRGLMKTLLDELISRHLDVPMIDFGVVLSDTVQRYVDKLRSQVPSDCRIRTRRNPGHFLDSTESAIAWALKNVGDAEQNYPTGQDAREADRKNGRGWSSAQRDQMHQAVDEYVAKFHEVQADGETTIWRAIRVPADVDPRDWIKWDCLGRYWSFVKRGAGDYGSDPEGHDRCGWPHVSGPSKVVVVEADVSTEGIDWEHGFTSFWYYGMDQFECALEPDVKVSVVSIDGLPVGEEIEARSNPRKTLRLSVRPDPDEPRFTSFFWKDFTGEPWQIFGAGSGGTPLGYLTPEKIQTRIARMIEAAKKHGYHVKVIDETRSA